MNAPLPAGRDAPSPTGVLDGATTYRLRLYVNAGTPTSSQAVVAARRFLETHLAGRYQLEILNIADHVERASADQVIASPTLIRLSPAPVRRFIGTLADEDRLRRTLLLMEVAA